MSNLSRLAPDVFAVMHSLKRYSFHFFISPPPRFQDALAAGSDREHPAATCVVRDAFLACSRMKDFHVSIRGLEVIYLLSSLGLPRITFRRRHDARAGPRLPVHPETA